MPLFWNVTLCDLAMSAPALFGSKSRILACSSILAGPFWPTI
jgi:hypothetical protein